MSRVPPLSPWRSNARRILALLFVIAAFSAMRLAADPRGPFDMGGRFAFARTPLPGADGPDAVPRLVRPTHPAIQHLGAFVTSVGAGAALHDLDGNGRADDICYVDTLTDRVLVAPAPATGERYPAFALDHTAGGRVSGLFDRDRMIVAGCLPVDANEDGAADLLVYYLGRPPILFVRTAGQTDGSRPAASSFSPTAIGAGRESWSSGSATIADLDGDGHVELIAVNWLANGAEAYDPQAATPIEMPDSMSSAFNGGGVNVFRIQPGARTGDAPAFVPVPDAVPAGVARGWGLAVGAADLDGDLLPELYIANDFGPDRLLWNRSTRGRIQFEPLEGDGGFAIPKSKVLGHDSFKGMGVDFGDLNGDGIADIYVSNITSPFAVLESQLVFLSTGDREAMARGRAPYVEASERLGLARTGWAWDAKLEDFDNDGVLEAVQATGFLKGPVSRWPELQELVLANDRLSSSPKAWPLLTINDSLAGADRNPFFVRLGERYLDIAGQIGFGEEHVSRGLAFGDVDADGRVDMVVANLGGPSTFYRNQGAGAGAFLGLRLLLPIERGSATTIQPGMQRPDRPARPAIGAAVSVTLPDGTCRVRQVDGGNGHAGKRSPDVHVGLGSSTGPLQVSIRWRDPDGTPREETHSLAPGWHTVVLGWPVS